MGKGAHKIGRKMSDGMVLIREMSGHYIDPLENSPHGRQPPPPSNPSSYTQQGS